MSPIKLAAQTRRSGQAAEASAAKQWSNKVAITWPSLPTLS